MRRTWRWGAIRACASVAVLAATFVPATPSATPTDAAVPPASVGARASTGAAEVGAGSIRGRVTDEFGTPIAGALVDATRTTDFDADYGEALTAADGTYEIAELTPGNYSVRADAAGYQREFAGGSLVAPGVAVFVSRSSITHDVNFSLGPAAGIAGRVTTGGSAGVAGVFVRATGAPGDFFATTDVNGYYVIEADPGTYSLVHVFGTGSLAPEAYNNTYDFDAATPVNVALGAQTPNISFDLANGGGVSGVIRDPDGVPLEGADVTAQGDGWFFGATSGPGGVYTITGMAPGQYKLRAHYDTYADTWYTQAFDEGSATAVAVSLGVTTTGKDIQLGELGSISGAVTNVPLFGAGIFASSIDCCWSGGTSIADDGPYSIAALQPGCYRVEISAFPQATQFYDGKYISELATPVCVTPGADTPSINFILGPHNPDDFEDLRMFGAQPIDDARSTAGATLEPSETQPCGNIGSTIWYRFALHPETAPGTQVEVDTAGSAFDTVVAVYSGDHILSPPGGIAPIVCNDDAGGPQARAVFTGTPGTTYYVQVGGKNGASGNAVLHIECIGDDDCDGDANAADTCDLLYNPDQADLDDDGLGDLCDPDVDGDGVSDSEELSLGTETRIADTDGDGCTEGREAGGNAQAGGDRDPLNYWDFFDVTGDRAIDLQDALAILDRFGAKLGDPGYDASYDRYVPDPSKPYRTAQTAGQHVGIDLEDALVNLQSFGHSCAS
jgi:hypothetical protein